MNVAHVLCLVFSGLKYSDQVSSSSISTNHVNITDTAEYRLYNHLFADYNPMLRPTSHNHETIDVELEFELSAVTNLDEVNEEMTTLGFVVAIWHDEYLKWDKEDYDNLTHLVIPAHKVWLPDCGIQNSANKFTDSIYWEDFRVDVMYTGRVIWKFGGIFVTTCTLDTTYYPFDMQKCDIVMENWAYTQDVVNLTAHTEEVHLQEFTENGEWALDHTGVTESVYTEDTHPGELFPKVTFSIYLSRKFRYYVINIILPAMFVITIALMVFWLPPDSGEKVSLGVTVLLAFSVFQLVIMEHTPRSSDFTPLMTLLFTIIMGAATFSVLTSILVLYYHHHGAESRPPYIVRYIAFNILARGLCMRRQVREASVICDNRRGKKMVDNEVKPFESDNHSVKHNNFMTAEDVTTVVEKVKSRGGLPPSVVTGGETEKYLQEILMCLQELQENMKQKEVQDEIVFEWKCLAIVVDRLMFWLAFLVIIITAPVMLLGGSMEAIVRPVKLYQDDPATPY